MYTLRYAATRWEVWRWYWRAWARPAGYWRIHLFLGVTAGLAAVAVQGSTRTGWSNLAVDVTASTAICILLLSLWPQLAFKPQMRTLDVDAEGYRTVIGPRTGSRPWSEILSVQDDGETVAITMRQGSAMLIPRRAFTQVDRGRFVADVTKWHAATARKP